MTYTQGLTHLKNLPERSSCIDEKASRKSTLRSRYRAKLKDRFSDDRQHQKSFRLALRIMCEAKSFRYLGIYSAYQHELDIKQLRGWARTKSKRLLLPKIICAQRGIMAFVPAPLKLNLAPGYCNILEPKLSSFVFHKYAAEGTSRARLKRSASLLIHHPEALFIPALAFDKRGYRLGYGGGFYDRYLSKHISNTTAIGVGNLEQLHKGLLPVNRFDMPMKKLLLV